MAKCDYAAREDMRANCGGMFCHVTGGSEYSGGLCDECRGDCKACKP